MGSNRAFSELKSFFVRQPCDENLASNVLIEARSHLVTAALQAFDKYFGSGVDTCELVDTGPLGRLSSEYAATAVLDHARQKFIGLGGSENVARQWPNSTEDYSGDSSSISIVEFHQNGKYLPLVRTLGSTGSFANHYGCNLRIHIG